MKYSTWFKWINASLVLLIIIAFIGTLPGSVQVVPYWPLLISLSLINLALCIIIGKIIKEDK